MMKTMVPSRRLIAVLICIFTAELLCAEVPEVMQTNPDEPVADLGIYGDSSPAKKEGGVTTFHCVLKNIEGTVIPFRFGVGSFEQGDKFGGFSLAGIRLVQDALFVATAYYGIMTLHSCVDIAMQKVDRTQEVVDEMYDNCSRAKWYGIASLCCWALDLTVAVWRPIDYNKKHGGRSVAFVPVVGVDACGAVAMVRF
jgi:hypothetical protein